MLRKEISNIWGTWESNPGPKAYWAFGQPLHHAALVIIGIISKYNKYKSIHVLQKTKHSRVILNGPMMYHHLIIVFTEPAKYMLDSGGF